MEYILAVIIIVICYVIGSIPFGLLVVRIASGKDVRKVGSGRTGGTNVMRAAGWFAGVITAMLDILKGLSSVWICGLILPGNELVKVFAAAAAVLGSIHSIFLAERDDNGKLRLRGGAGGATSLGGAMALWGQIWMIILPVGVAVYLLVGFASMTTISIALSSLVIFAFRTWVWGEPWQYILYGAIDLLLVAYALIPNLKRMAAGNERTVGLRAYLKKRRGEKTE